MVINTVAYMLCVSLLGFFRTKLRTDKIVAWFMFIAISFLFYNYIDQILLGLNKGFSFFWNETKIGNITIDFHPSSINNEQIVPLFFVTLFIVLNNNIFRYEERRSLFNSLIVLNFISLCLLICAKNYVQLITSVFISDIIGYMVLKDVDSSRRYVIYNFISDMCLFMILSMVSGRIQSLDISKLFTFDQVGQHKDFVGLVTLIAIFIKIGAFSFHSYLSDISKARFQRVSTINIVFCPIYGILLLLKLHNLLNVSDLFLPIYKIISALTFVTGVIFFILKDDIRKKLVYFNMAGFGTLMIMLYEKSFDWNILFSYYYIILYFYNVLFFKLYLYQNRTDNVSDMINAKEINKEIMLSLLLIITILTNLFITIMLKIAYIESNTLVLYLGAIIFVSLAIVLNHIYRSPKSRRLDYLNKNSLRAFSFIINSLILILASYHFGAYKISNLIIVSLFIILVANPFFIYLRKFYNSSIIQETELSSNVYYYLFVLPIKNISRILWLMVDALFSEKVITIIINRINKWAIMLFFKLNKRSYPAIIVFIILGILAFVASFYIREMP